MIVACLVWLIKIITMSEAVSLESTYSIPDSINFYIYGLFNDVVSNLELFYSVDWW